MRVLKRMQKLKKKIPQRSGAEEDAKTQEFFRRDQAAQESSQNGCV
jgi:hypothetical protein